MKVRYCLPIIKPTQQEILELIESNLTQYHYFEVWLDYIDNVEQDFIQDLIDLLGTRLILLFRRQKLEDIRMSPERRLAILDIINHTDVLIDLDISSQTTELDYTRREGSEFQVITSYHNYKETPTTMQQKRIIATMTQYKPFMYKFASECHDEKSALQLLQLLLELKDSGHVATIIGMGRKGQITRLYGIIWGNEITFAPSSESEASAPGQLTRTQYEVLLKELGY